MFDLLDGLVVFILFLLLLYLGWRSTEVRDYTYSHPPGAASTSGLLSSSGLHRSSLDSVPVRGNLLNRLVDQIQTSNLRNRRRRGVQTQHQQSDSNSVEEIEYNEGNILMTHVLSWASNESISTGTNTESAEEEARLRRHTEYLIDGIQGEAGPEEIIREMDRDLLNSNPTDASASSSTVYPAAADGSVRIGAEEAELENCTNENNENVNKQAAEGEETNAPLPPSIATTNIDEDPWKIKIKYLNDDMKVVEAKPSQSLGEFKRQNFVSELAANKLVRLVFNGKVLQPEGRSLRNCGLFENCVVHCLVHNMQNFGGSSGVGGGNISSSNSSAEGGGLMMGPSNSSAMGTRNTTFDDSPEGVRQRIYATGDVILENDDGLDGLGLGGPGIGSSEQQMPRPHPDYSTTHLMRNRFQQWLFQHWNRLYNWRFFTELLLLAFTITTIYLRVRYAELFTATATIGLILVSVMILGFSVTINVM